MSDKLPTINIKGKEYVMVKDRIHYFNAAYPNGSIVTEILSPIDADKIVVRAVVLPNIETPTRRFVGHSQAVVGQGMINSTAALENCETSAVGRALALLGIGVIESVASADEVNKAVQSSPNEKWIGNEEATDQAVTYPTRKDFCSIHNKDMRLRTGKNGNTWYDHRWQDDQGEWLQCTGLSPDTKVSGV